MSGAPEHIFYVMTYVNIYGEIPVNVNQTDIISTLQ